MKNTLIIAVIALVIGVVGGAVLFKGETSDLSNSGAGLAAVPEGAYGPSIPEDKGYLVEEIKDGVYWVTDGTYQVMFVTTGEGVVVVDAPPSMGEKILSAISDVTEEPITHVIYSHSHADHIAAASMYPEDAQYIAHEDTASQLARTNRAFPFGTFLGGSPAPTPTQTFSDSLTLNVGNKTLQLDYKGANHEPGNIFVYAPQQKVLLLIDVIFPGWSPFKELAVSENVPGYIKAHDDILSYDFDVLISGHLGRLGTREDVETQKEYILDMQKNAAKALQEVDFFAIVEEVGFDNPWDLFNTYLTAVEENCADATVPDWTDKLGGVDVFTNSHCAKIIESLRID